MERIDITKKLSTPYKVRTVEKAVKDVDLEKRVVSGLFNTSFFIDSDMDMLLPGAASKSIQERGVNSLKGNKIKHLKDHDWSKNIARIDVLEERTVDFEGRQLEGIYHESFYPTSSDSNDQLIKIQEGMYDSRSIGFQYVKIDLVEEGMEDFDKFLSMAINPEVGRDAGFFWVVKEIKLWEGSDVSFGANELTPTLGVKSGSKEIVQQKAFDKLDAAMSLMKSGSLSDEGFHRLDMEIKQIKSYIASLTDLQPSKKDTDNSRPSENTSGSKNFLLELIKK